MRNLIVIKLICKHCGSDKRTRVRFRVKVKDKVTVMVAIGFSGFFYQYIEGYG